MKTNYTRNLIQLSLAIALLATWQPAAAQTCTPLGDQTTYGSSNTWIGYVYQGINFNTYKGYVNEGNAGSPAFDQNFGGNQVSYATNGCSVYTDTFSVRYKLSKTFADGNYTFTVGGDDGYRLSLDGGSTWIISKWTDQSYVTTSTTVHLNGTYNMVLEYYEKYVNNRISFSVVSECLGTGDPSQAGTGNIWRGYLYQGVSFNTYKGFVTEGTGSNPNFNETFGGANVSFPTNSCSVTTENFSARFRLNSTIIGGSTITVGGDDGYRLSLDGGSTWVINKWNDQSYTTTNYTVPASGNYNLVLEYYERGGDNRVSFSMVAASTLPVKLMTWHGKAVSGNRNELGWTTSSEINFDHFVVQRSVTGQQFADIASIPAAGAGNSPVNSYQYTDEHPATGINYYRLMMVDRDGSAAYSGILVISGESQTSTLRIFPTVIEQKSVTIESPLSISQARIEVYDMNGRMVTGKNQAIFAGRQAFDLGAVRQTGTYLIRISNGGEIIQKQMLLVK